MLHYFKFENYFSFASEAAVDLVVSERGHEHKWVARAPSGRRFSTVTCVMGANGAGKTVALRPLAFLGRFIKDSFSPPPDADIDGIEPHFDHADKPSSFEVEAEDRDGTVWRYHLVATRRMVLRETLRKMGERSFSMVFDREWDPASNAYRIKQRGFGFQPKEAVKVRPNASLISTAAQYAVPTALYLTTRLHIAHNIEAFGRQQVSWRRIEQAATVFAANEDLMKHASQLLSSWDLGLSAVDLDLLDRTDIATGTTEKVWVPLGVHKRSSGATHNLLLFQESSGTQAAFLMLSHVLPALRSGGLAVLDEVDGDLHPHMLEPLLDLFASQETNPHKAQLIFTCHSPDVLASLQKSQVHFVQKDDGNSEIYRADAIAGLRADDNMRAKYMSGALGAIPRV